MLASVLKCTDADTRCHPQTGGWLASGSGYERAVSRAPNFVSCRQTDVGGSYIAQSTKIFTSDTVYNITTYHTIDEFFFLGKDPLTTAFSDWVCLRTNLISSHSLSDFVHAL